MLYAPRSPRRDPWTPGSGATLPTSSASGDINICHAIYIYIYMYVCMYTCIYIYIYIHTYIHM